MSNRTDRLSTYLGTCPTTGKRMHETAAKAKKAARLTGKGLHSYRCPDCDIWNAPTAPSSVGRGDRPCVSVRRQAGASAAKLLFRSAWTFSAEA